MAKVTAELTDSISVFWLKEHGYLEKGCVVKSGGITWTYAWNDYKSSISFSVIRDNLDESGRIELRYTWTDPDTEEKLSMNYNVYITTTACNYGGVRHWFTCPLYRNKQYCGRRVGVLYYAGKYFGCRKCANIAYRSQMKGGRSRCSVTVPDIVQMGEKVKREYYNGKPTRKYRRYLKMDAALRRAYLGLVMRIMKYSKGR
jgi:hypothetical protein